MNSAIKILVVDDDPNMLFALARPLRAAGYDVLKGTSGKECLELTQQYKPDILLLDVVLPDLSGIEVCKRIKADPSLNHTFVVLVSGLKTSSEDQSIGLEEGADDFLVKPLSKRELLARIRAILRIKRAETALRESKEAAETANRAKSQFLANMSHELRTPLNAILGYSQLFLRETTLPEQVQKGHEIIHRNAEHLLAMINTLLDLTKIESGKMELAYKPFQLMKVLHAVADTVHLHAQAKQLDVRCDFDPGLPQIIAGDEQRLRQILLNVLGNAVKFTEKGMIRLKGTVVQPNAAPQALQSDHPAALQAPKQQTIIRFIVEDSGPGIPAEALEKIFEPFYQGVIPHQGKTSGTGLGLPICRQFLRLMGSELHVRSTPGQGATFWFDLPVNVNDDDEQIEQAEDVHDQAATLEETSLPALEEILVTPPPEIILSLEALARIGDIRGLERQLDALEDGPSQWQPFIRQLTSLIQGIKLHDVQRFLAHFLEQ